MSARVIHGDCMTEMRQLPDASVHAVVTDPPYGLGFMGKAWDALPPGVEWAAECLRVLRPGGHLLAFGGTRTWHRLACAVEDAGFEVRDSLAWLYGSGFPKSLDVGKAIDKAAGAEREVVGRNPRAAQQTPKTDATSLGRFAGTSPDLTAPATDAARRWDGWGTALKPAFEPVVVARKPLVGTVAANVCEHGTGALHIDACRVGMSDEDADFIRRTARPNTAGQTHAGDIPNVPGARTVNVHSGGRWPANVVLDESQAEALDAQSGHRAAGGHPASAGIRSNPGANGTMGDGWAGIERAERMVLDAGGASRFFYVAKAPKRERPRTDTTVHPTVKPLTLMRWLVRLVTPPGGTVLDPFAGSGTTAEACLLEGFDCIAIEREADYLPLIEQRLARHAATLAFDEVAS